MSAPTLTHVVDAGSIDEPINQTRIESLMKYATDKGHCGCLLTVMGIRVIVLANGVVAHDTPPARVTERKTPTEGTPRQDSSLPR